MADTVDLRDPHYCQVLVRSALGAVPTHDSIFRLFHSIADGLEMLASR